MNEAFPLTWPMGWPRTQRRESSRFNTSFVKARYVLLNELRLMDCKEVIISSNLMLRNDGLPYAQQKNPDDPGIAVYFKRNDLEQCIPCDKWSDYSSNLQAIAKTIQALRGLERWGAKDIVDRAFTGFIALPSPEQIMIGAPAFFSDCINDDDVKARFKLLAKELHPDKGGSSEEFNELKRQYEVALSK